MRGNETEHLNLPHGGNLVDLTVEARRRKELRAASREWLEWDLTSRQLCDLELLMNGGYSPLNGFMGRADYESVCSLMRLANGLIWPIPVVLDVQERLAKQLHCATPLALRDAEGVIVAVLHVEEVWEPDRRSEVQEVFGTDDSSHSGASYVLNKTNPFYVSGRLEGLQPPIHYDYRTLRLTPAEARSEFARLGWRRIIAFQPQHPMHRADVELTLRVAKDATANVLIHPSVGAMRPSDIDHHTRVRCYQAILPYYPANTAKLALLPLVIRSAGAREAVWHAIIRKNFGCTHFIVDHSHADPGNNFKDRSLCGTRDAQTFFRQHVRELGVSMVPFAKLTYLQDKDTFVKEDEVPASSRPLTISADDLRARLTEGREIPSWFSYPQVVKELRRSHPPRSHQGFTVFFTGLSGSGKSTIANALLTKLLEAGDRPVTLLDGDIVRKNLSSELGFSREHRDVNIRRIGFVAREITKNGGIAICAPIAPYDSIRKEVRESIESVGGFALVYVSTSLDVCEQRDRKGLYAKARTGIIQAFTGVSDPYEPPADAHLVIDTANMSPDEAAHEILLHLEKEGYVAQTEGAV